MSDPKHELPFLPFVTSAGLIVLVGTTVWTTVIRPMMERQREIDPLYQKHLTLCDKAHACLDRLAQKRPGDVPREDWEYMVDWSYNAKANCLECPEYIEDYPRFHRFVDEFEERLDGEVGIETIDWIWDEIEAISSLPLGNHRPTVRVWIRALDRPGERYPTREEALRRLRHHTGQDFGDDAKKWEEWYSEYMRGPRRPWPAR